MSRRLSRERELELVSAAGTGDSGARLDLVEAYMPLIGAVASRYPSAGIVDRVDLMQDGVVGLLRALERFDPGVGASFWAYASWWVRQAMQQTVAELARPIVLSDRALRQLASIKRAIRAHLQATGSEPTTAELAETTGLKRAQVERLLAVENTPRGLEEPSGGDEAGTRTVGERISDPRAEDAYDNALRHIEVGVLRHMRGTLSKRERHVLRARYGFGRRAQTLREVGGYLQVSAERVRQIEDDALEKLREAWPGAA